MSHQPSSASESSSSTQPAAKVSPVLWVITIVLASFVGWFAYTHPPKAWRVPDSMANIGPLSPAADQARLAANQNSNLWNNTLLKFSLAGLGLGLCGFILYSTSLGSRLHAALWTLNSGILAGLAAGGLGLITRQYFNLERPIPLISEASRPLFCDSVVFALVSTLLLIPLAVMLWFHPHAEERGKSPAILFAGVLTGMLVPFTSALLFAHTNTGVFPPVSADPSLVLSATSNSTPALDAPVTAEDLAKANASTTRTAPANSSGFHFGLTELWFMFLGLTALLLALLSGSRKAKPSVSGA